MEEPLLQIQCTGCRSLSGYTREQAGISGPCPFCGTTITTPSLSPELPFLDASKLMDEECFVSHDALQAFADVDDGEEEKVRRRIGTPGVVGSLVLGLALVLAVSIKQFGPMVMGERLNRPSKVPVTDPVPTLAPESASAKQPPQGLLNQVSVASQYLEGRGDDLDRLATGAELGPWTVGTGYQSDWYAWEEAGKAFPAVNFGAVTEKGLWLLGGYLRLERSLPGEYTARIGERVLQEWLDLDAGEEVRAQAVSLGTYSAPELIGRGTLRGMQGRMVLRVLAAGDGGYFLLAAFGEDRPLELDLWEGLHLISGVNFGSPPQVNFHKDYPTLIRDLETSLFPTPTEAEAPRNQFTIREATPESKDRRKTLELLDEARELARNEDFDKALALFQRAFPPLGEDESGLSFPDREEASTLYLTLLFRSGRMTQMKQALNDSRTQDVWEGSPRSVYAAVYGELIQHLQTMDDKRLQELFLLISYFREVDPSRDAQSDVWQYRSIPLMVHGGHTDLGVGTLREASKEEVHWDACLEIVEWAHDHGHMDAIIPLVSNMRGIEDAGEDNPVALRILALKAEAYQRTGQEDQALMTFEFIRPFGKQIPGFETLADQILN